MTVKTVRTEGYNYNFNTENGHFVRWGKTMEEDPKESPLGPEILDLEVSTICHGGHEACQYCYKGNGPKGENMSFETFKKLLDKMPDNLTQIAFGIGDIDGNPDLRKIMEYTRSKGIIPNITINGYRMTPDWYDFLAGMCGSVAVSRYENDVCFNAVKELTDRGLEQVNIHQVLCEDSYEDCAKLMSDSKTDKRLKKLNAVLFLMLKPKGRGVSVPPLTSIDKFRALVDYAFEHDIKLGFDSCSAPWFEKYLDQSDRFGDNQKREMLMYVESCESFGLFSSYINVSGLYFPCSFAEGEGDWKEGINVLCCNDFINDVWYHPKLQKYREMSLNNCYKSGCRKCLIFDQINPM